MILRLAIAVTLGLAQIAQADVAVTVAYLHVEQPLPPTLSNLDPLPDDLGLAGVRTGIADNATTGRFLGQTYALIDGHVATGEDPLAAAQDLLQDTKFLILNAAPEIILQIADLPEARDALLFNISAGDVSLRDDACRANLLHALPSVAMRTDALAQVLVQKRWTDLAMIIGGHPQDEAYAVAMRASLTKFGLKPGPEKQWLFDADMRRNAAQEVPLFTQELGDYDALIVADELHDFGRYVLYNGAPHSCKAASRRKACARWHPRITQAGPPRAP